jgi:RHS repeat-associated protein
LPTPLLATTATGATQWRENHRPYGDKLNYEPAASANTIGYAGKPFDNATGLSYMGARYYNPVLGRFMGVDPVGYSEANIHSHNRYAYANNNPYKFVDPDGRVPVQVIGFAIGFGVDVAAQIGSSMIGGNSFGDAVQGVSLTSAAYAGVATAFTGTVGLNQAINVTKGATTLGKAVATTSVVGASANTAATVASKLTKGEEINPMSLGISAAAGAAGGAWGVNSLGKAISPAVQGVNKAVQYHVAETTMSAGYPSSGVAVSAAKAAMTDSVPGKIGLSTSGKVAGEAINNEK